MANTKLAIVGFPKCGTTALTRALGNHPDVKMLLRPDGQIEVTWPLIKELELAEEPDPNLSIVVHKFTAYIYSPSALRHLAEDPTRKFVLCVRDPLKALVSWHNMHRRIAEEGRLENHFAYKNRNFYLNCTVDEYFAEYAASRLDYDKRFERLVTIAGHERVLVISQERMADSMDKAVEACRRFSGSHAGPVSASDSTPHVAYADKADSNVSQAIQETLRLVAERLSIAVSTSGVSALM